MHAFTIPGVLSPLTVYIGFIGEFLVASISRSVMHDILAISQYGGSLLANADYQLLSSLLPEENYAVGYLNLSRIQARLRQTSSAEWFSKLLDARQHLGPQLPGMMWTSTVIENGMMTQSLSPFGGFFSGTALVWLTWREMNFPEH